MRQSRDFFPAKELKLDNRAARAARAITVSRLFSCEGIETPVHYCTEKKSCKSRDFFPAKELKLNRRSNEGGSLALSRDFFPAKELKLLDLYLHWPQNLRSRDFFPAKELKQHLPTFADGFLIVSRLFSCEGIETPNKSDGQKQ